MTTILAIDPGSKQKKGTLDVRGTGWAVMEIWPDVPPELLATGLHPGGTQSLLDGIQGDGELADYMHRARLVVVENFRLLEARASIEPLEMVGVIRGFCAAQGKTVVVQEPADRTIVSHDDLKRIGMWPGGKGHADEAQAVRHGLAWASKSGNRPTVELLVPDPGDQPNVEEESGPSAW